MSGWGSWLSSESNEAGVAIGPNFKPISDTPQDQLLGPLSPEDLQWTCAGGFTTETQTWYSILEDGSFAASQIIHSAVGLWYPQIQITFKYFNPKTGQKIWKSVNVTHFSKTYDKRSCKADQFTILFDTLPNGDEKYTIDANIEADLQLSWSFTRVAGNLGWKLGAGSEGGKSVFGSNPTAPDGYVVHRFWPRVESSGIIIAGGKMIEAQGQGMFVHAIQGMRPNLVASKWNFANFQSKELGGVAAIMMEFTTANDYGDPADPGSAVARKPLTVNVGSISVGGKLVTVTASTRGRDHAPASSSTSYVDHQDTEQDADTGYNAPTKIQYGWTGHALDASNKPSANKASAEIKLDLGKPYPSTETKGLVDKVDVLAEIPYVVRKMVNYVAGTKPYIYQTLNSAKISLDLPAGSPSAGSHTLEGTLFEEHTFINV
ncbi:oxidative stress survival, Svf1-like protein [Tilletiaria anomala UBC 951]|uniref:Oxidative stress survival, Svf1-like protein n=1 Tax=Tilletiaria anomala (strain ATCC 24038 / CBS 436.72 / UBC 951) TaxID=1037660 RepID=A0A066VDC3_TILAU|nr:oxidative stress survival, Svf1-like protein [Tilletiaria anomala UBC 951]KDN39446.1 oxidative stress survival, Svf1-like protein [Tilletiaria anomala UBC 951]